MMKEEFEKLIGKEISSKEYEIVEFVYTWHPAISEVNGKKQMAALYMQHGLSVIKDMVEMAELMQKVSAEQMKVNQLRAKVQERINRLVGGDLRYERCRMEMKRIFATVSVEEGNILINNLCDRYGHDTVKLVRAELNY